MAQFDHLLYPYNTFERYLAQKKWFTQEVGLCFWLFCNAVVSVALVVCCWFYFCRLHTVQFFPLLFSFFSLQITQISQFAQIVLCWICKKGTIKILWNSYVVYIFFGFCYWLIEWQSKLVFGSRWCILIWVASVRNCISLTKI